jgi:hypothetical protein
VSSETSISCYISGISCLDAAELLDQLIAQESVNVEEAETIMSGGQFPCLSVNYLRS